MLIGKEFGEQMKQPISGYHRDLEGNWVADLKCGHTHHLRHNPPWKLRPWVKTVRGCTKHIGNLLDCKKCEYSRPHTE